MQQYGKHLCLIIGLSTTITMADDWTVTTSNFESRHLSIEAIDEKKLIGKLPDQSDFILALDQFIEATRSTRIDKLKGVVLYTSSGDRLIGKPVRIEGTAIIWSATGIGEIAVPLEQALVISKDVADQDQLSVSHLEDEIQLANGDVVKGIVTSMTADVITITPSGAQAIDIPVESVKSLYFTTPPQGRSLKKSTGYVIHLTSGAIVTCRNMAFKDSTIDLILSGNASATVDQKQIAVIEHLGSSLNWLSSRKPEKIEYVPYFSGQYSPQMDRTVTGEPIRSGDTTYHHGIGMHSKTRMTWSIQPDDKTFRAKYFIDAGLGYADVDVRAWVDDNKVHESIGFKSGMMSPVISADLTGAKSLTLEVDYGKGYDIQDRVNWIDAAILQKDSAK